MPAVEWMSESLTSGSVAWAAMPSRYADLDRPPLHQAALRLALVHPGGMWTHLEVLDQTPSTNALLAARASEVDIAGTVVIAESQTAGRGRLGRSWTAPPRSGLTMSALVRPYDVDVARWPWIPLLTGLAVAAALRREAQVEAELKWPNDVLVGGRKLAGVLVERVESARQPAAAVVGIGINVSLRSDELPTAAATSLLLEGSATTDRTLLAKAVLRALERLLTQWEQRSGDPSGGLSAAYVEACGTLGRPVRVGLPGGSAVEGEATGVDGTGRLLVRTAGVEHAYAAGDVVHLVPLA